MVEMSHPCLAQLPQYQAEPRCVSLACAPGAFLEQAPTSRLGHSALEPGWQGESTEDWGNALEPSRGGENRGMAAGGTTRCWQGSEAKLAH